VRTNWSAVLQRKRAILKRRSEAALQNTTQLATLKTTFGHCRLLGQAVAFPRAETNTAVIFSEPEIGMAGLSEEQARQAGLDVAVARYDYRHDARAQIDGRDNGLLKIVYEKDSRRVIGVHALVEGAGNLMGEAALLIQAGLPLEAIAAAIHPHPTLTESFALAVRSALAMRV